MIVEELKQAYASGNRSFYRADLRSADLRSADLSGADLSGADLRSADLSGAVLSGAVLSGAVLRNADLRSAVLSGAVLPTGETWEQYLSEVVPAFLEAGGKSLSQILVPEHWDCHTWDNCPTAAAFSTNGYDKIPRLLHPRAEQFIYFFDQGLITLEMMQKNNVQRTKIEGHPAT